MPELKPEVAQALQPEINANPLRQYFRRPAIHIKLPSGADYYSDTVVQYPPTGELPVYPMTALDEITARTPDAAFNGSAVTDIIRSCVPAILDPWQITTVDLDAILVAIRIATIGQNMEVDCTCPKCREVTPYEIPLTPVMQALKPGNYQQPVHLDDGLDVVLQPLTYYQINNVARKHFDIQKTLRTMTEESGFSDEQLQEIQKRMILELNEINQNIVLDSIKYVQTPEAVVQEPEYILEFLQNCTKRDFETIQRRSTELRDASQIRPVKITCAACENVYEQSYSVNPSDFFD